MNSPCREDDSKIVEACIEGDVTAWESLVARYSPLIHTAISDRIRSYGMDLPRQDVEDIVQNALTSIWEGRKLSEIKNRADISYWLAIVSGNMAVEYLRGIKASGTDKTMPLNDAEDDAGYRVQGTGYSETAATYHNSNDNEISDKIKEALGCLRKKERLIMKLFIFHEKKYDDISEILNMPKGTVSSYIRRSRVKLKRILKYLQ